jgi:hypothetical protein
VKRRTLMIAAGAFCALALAALAPAAAKKAVWTAPLTSGQEIPKQVVKNTAAHGLFKGTLTGHKLKWRLTFAKLTGSATAAHIHLGRKGTSGNVLIPLCAPCKSPVSGTATIGAAVMKDFKKHLLYVNVHTTKNPGGEIRGQLAAG